jgi:ABC-2 type transport system ATP-binding protein
MYSPFLSITADTNGVPVSQPLPVLSPPTSESNAVLAVDVVELRKEFRRKAPRGTRGPRRRRVAALAGITFAMARGETVAILGQNGSGKSTLVRLLSTLLLPDGGSAKVFGRDVRREARAVRRLVNRVSVEASFFKKMSAVENLSYAARYYGMSPRQTRDRIPHILERVSFPVARRSEPMENLSRGMQQKVALARALLTAPVLLLLDEPTTGLDPRSKLEVQDFVREIRDLHDATILLCTHDLAEAEALADRIGIINRGRLLRLEAPDALKAAYGAATLEEAFFAATGRALSDDTEEDDDNREDQDDYEDERDVFA